MLDLKVKSTRFLGELRRRQESLTGKLSAKLVAPPELKWWYYLEFGTTGPYKIEPHQPPFALRWFDATGNPVVRDEVIHPGIKARAFIRKVLPEIQRESVEKLMQMMLTSGFRATVLQEALESEVMPAAKQRIVDSLALETKQTPRNDPGAKMLGKTAAQAFNDLTTIEIQR